MNHLTEHWPEFQNINCESVAVTDKCEEITIEEVQSEVKIIKNKKLQELYQ